MAISWVMSILLPYILKICTFDHLFHYESVVNNWLVVKSKNINIISNCSGYVYDLSCTKHLLEVWKRNIEVWSRLVGDRPHDDCWSIFVPTHQLLHYLTMVRQTHIAEIFRTNQKNINSILIFQFASKYKTSNAKHWHKASRLLYKVVT